MGNILSAIKSIVANSSLDVVENPNEIIHNRANQMGIALEDYVKNAFANCIGQSEREIKYARNKTFSYLGNSNNPPDAMLAGSDAIEIKKLESLGTSQLQLNSSYPKNKLYSNNPKISITCRTCEEWDEKDMLYIVGQVKNQELHNIFLFTAIYIVTPMKFMKVLKMQSKRGYIHLKESNLQKQMNLGGSTKLTILKYPTFE